MIFLLKYRKIIAVAAVVALTNFATYRYVHNAWDAERTNAANDALREKSRMEAQYRALEAMQAENTRNMEADYAKRVADIDAGRADFERRLTERVRRANGAGNCGVPGPAGRSGSPEEPEPAGDRRLGQIDLGAVSRVRQIGKETQEMLRLCREWATSVGR